MMIALLGALLFAIVASMTFLLLLGFPLGEFSMGGKYKVIPPKLRILCALSLIIQLFAIVIILQGGMIMAPWFSPTTTKYILYGFTIYLVLNTAMNQSSTSRKERLVATPLSALAAICCFLTGFAIYT